MNRIIIFATLLLSAMTVMADKKMRIRNADAGESFEITVPEGFKMYSCIGNWLDSIPYLLEHARYGEPWAYEALAECHRHGKGAVKRSLINALFFYDLAGKNVEDCMAEIAQANYEDPIAVFSRLVDYIENKDFDRVVCAIDTLNEAGYHSANVLLKCIHNSKQVEQEDIVEFAADSETDPDAAVFACAGYALCNNSDSIKIDISWARPLIMDKIPYIYSLIGAKKYENTIKSDNPDGYAEDATTQDIDDRRKAAEYFLKADEFGALTKDSARLVHHYLTCDSTSKWVDFSDEDMYRLQILADIDE